MLEEEGFKFDGRIDLIDGGPVMEARINDLIAIKNTRSSKIDVIKKSVEKGCHVILSNTEFQGFKAAFATINENTSGITITENAARCLNLKRGDPVKYIS